MINAFFTEDKDPGEKSFYRLTLAHRVARIPGFHPGSIQFSCSVESASLWPHGLQHAASLAITNSQSLLKLMSIESVMPSNHSGYPGSIPGQKSRSTPHTTAHYCLAIDQNQSILKEINSEYSLEGLLLKLKLQYFGHQMRKAQFIGKDPDAGKDWKQKEKGVAEDEMVRGHHRLNGNEFE